MARTSDVPQTKSLKDRLFGTAVMKMSFRLRGTEKSQAFLAIYKGILRDLELNDADVEDYILRHLDDVERAARGTDSSD